MSEVVVIQMDHIEEPRSDVIRQFLDKHVECSEFTCQTMDHVKEQVENQSSLRKLLHTEELFFGEDNFGGYFGGKFGDFYDSVIYINVVNDNIEVVTEKVAKDKISQYKLHGISATFLLRHYTELEKLQDNMVSDILPRTLAVGGCQ